MNTLSPIDGTTVFWRLAVTFLFVLLNGFFVAAEFSLVKVRRSRIDALADAGNSKARVIRDMLQRIDLYLSACQFGITIASLILGWLAEPAIARLLLAGADALGWEVQNGALLHGISLGIALAIVTTLHITLGEQAPKIFAVHRPESTALRIAYPLKIFTWVFRPLIWVINRISNAMLRIVNISPDDHSEGSLTAEELRIVLMASAQAGHISPRQRKFAENILGFIDLQVRHILVSRIDVARLSINKSSEENLKAIRASRHSRFPLCGDDLDDVIGIVHAKDALALLIDKQPVDLRKMARRPVFVPDTQSLGLMIVELQRNRAKAAVVVDDRGTAIGMAFLEDAIEEIVGPIQDEFDDEEPAVRKPSPSITELRGDFALPEAVELLGIDAAGTDDTIGGHVVSALGRLPEQGDTLQIGSYHVTVVEVARRRIVKLRFEQKEKADIVHEE